MVFSFSFAALAEQARKRKRRVSAIAGCCHQAVTNNLELVCGT
jgi:hypothetical protein